ncbi:MAG: nitroreductase family deazaflavin-dependent oxidoreductase [Thermomicrobiales bacterium]
MTAVLALERPWWQRAVMRVAATRAGAWGFARLAHRLDRQVLRLTGGGHTLTSLLAGLPIVWLTTTGARSGRTHTVPLVGIVDSARIVLIASNFGQARNPAWYHNLRAQPCATIAARGQSARYHCREAAGEEYNMYWAEALALFPGWANYHARAPRHIPILVFTPDPSF